MRIYNAGVCWGSLWFHSAAHSCASTFIAPTVAIRNNDVFNCESTSLIIYLPFFDSTITRLFRRHDELLAHLRRRFPHFDVIWLLPFAAFEQHNDKFGCKRIAGFGVGPATVTVWQEPSPKTTGVHASNPREQLQSHPKSSKWEPHVRRLATPMAAPSELASELAHHYIRPKSPLQVSELAALTAVGPLLPVAQCYSNLENIIHLSNHQQCTRCSRQFAL